MPHVLIVGGGFAGMNAAKVLGRASDVQVVKSSGVPALDEATVKGMAKLRFEPAKDGNGKPIAWCPPVYSPYVFTVVWRLPE